MKKIWQLILGVTGSPEFLELFKGQKQKQREFELAMMDALLAEQSAQIEVNKVEASHRSIWVAGWRPAVGWVCVVALAYNFVIQPAIGYFFRVFELTNELPPDINLAPLMTILLGMLGLAGYRTIEKIKGKDNSSVPFSDRRTRREEIRQARHQKKLKRIQDEGSN